MFSLNRAQIIGNLTRDPEMRYVPSGQAVCSFGVATNRRWRDKDGNTQDQTEFHNIVVWGKMAENANQYLKKGNKVFIEGRLQTRNWDGQDGTKHNRTEIIAENMIYLTPKGEYSPSSSGSSAEAKIEDAPEEKLTSKKSEPEPKEKTSDNEDDINLDEIPF